MANFKSLSTGGYGILRKREETGPVVSTDGGGNPIEGHIKID